MFESEGAVLNELLRERGLISDAQLVEIQEEHERTGKPLSQIIVDFGLMNEEQLLQALALHLNMEFIQLENTELPANVLRSMPSSAARMYGAVPIAATGNSVTVAVLDPYNPHLAEELTFVLGKDVHLALAPPKQIESIIARYYSEESGSLKDVLQDMEKQLADSDIIATAEKGGAQGVAALEELASQAPIVRFVNLILFQAIQVNF